MTERKPRQHRLRKYLMTGLLVWVPLTITFFVMRFLVNLVDRVMLLVPRVWRPETLLGFDIPGLGVLLALLLLILTGVGVTHFLGHRLVTAGEALLGRIPFVGGLYRGSKQLAETVLAPDSKSFRKVVLIRWPHRDSRALAFLTGSQLGEVQEKTSEQVVSVFLPTTPNPTSGFILMVPAEDIVELEMSVDEAFRMIVSLGVVVPEWPREAREALKPAAADPSG